MSLKSSCKFAGLGGDFYARVEPSGFERPFLISYNHNAAKLISFDQSPESLIPYLSGQQKIEGGDYLASVYAGHQFGTYVPQLGDGRAILVGEAGGYEIQLKGSGKTPFSRFGDGRAVLRSTIREYLCSEAMFGLGIPTTRALAIIGSDEDVQRETVEKAAMLTRLAPSHIRFGHFEYFYYTGQKDNLRKLADFVIANYYAGASYEEFFAEIVLRTARLIAGWQAVGFAHGVMNTDNMSILGLTIDYGPFGFMESYDPGFICNHSDYSGRYAFNEQPAIGLWNLFALAQALVDLVEQEKLERILKTYQPELAAAYLKLMQQKLGADVGIEMIGEILDLLAEERVDYTIFFSDPYNAADLFVDREKYRGWVARVDGGKSKNPHYILRNYLAEQAIQKAQNGDYSEIDKLLKLLQNPYQKQAGMEAYIKAPPEWAKSLEISCSS